jgi:hypothetical protein
MSASFARYAERPDEGNTIRQPSVALLCVDSYDTYQSPNNLGSFSLRSDLTPYNSLIYKKQALMAGKISRISLTEINFNWSIPTITEYNNTFSLLQAIIAPVVFDQTITFTIPIGWYNFTTLATAIAAGLNANLGGLTGTFAVTVDPITYFFTITYTFGAGEAGNTPLIEDTELSTMLGFEGKRLWSAPASITSSITGNFPRLTYTPYFDIVSQRLTKNQSVYDNSSSDKSPVRSILTRIYLNNSGIDQRPDEDFVVGARPFTFKEQYNLPKQISWEPTENIDSVDLLVVDSKGRTLYNQPAISDDDVIDVINNFTGNSATFQFTLQCSEN